MQEKALELVTSLDRKELKGEGGKKDYLANYIIIIRKRGECIR